MAGSSGTGIATANGSVGWVGMIFVDEGLRGRGVGTAPDRGRHRPCSRPRAARPFALLASPLGRPIYERLGFRAEMDYRLLVADGGTLA